MIKKLRNQPYAPKKWSKLQVCGSIRKKKKFHKNLFIASKVVRNEKQHTYILHNTTIRIVMCNPLNLMLLVYSLLPSM
jgi:hypothetical protein